MGPNPVVVIVADCRFGGRGLVVREGVETEDADATDGIGAIGSDGDGDA